MDIRKWFTNKKSSQKEYGNSAPDASTLEEISYVTNELASQPGTREAGKRQSIIY